MRTGARLRATLVRLLSARREVAMVVISSGQPAPTPGFYVDEHGHRLLLRPAEPAPLCKFSGATPIRWRLVQPVPMPKRSG